MNILQKYIAMTILQMIGLVLLALLGLEIFILFISQLNHIGTGNYGIFAAFLYVLLNLPAQLYSLFPMAGMLGMMLALGLLASHSELIVMRAAGMSIQEIARSVMQVVLLLVLLVTVIGETIAPLALHYANQFQQYALTRGEALRTHEGTWLRDGRNFIHINKIISAHELAGLSRYKFDDQQRLIQASYAEHAYYVRPDWRISQIKTTYISPNHTHVESQANATWQLNLNPGVLKNVSSEPEAMSLLQLYQTIMYHRSSETHANVYELSLWQRIFQPLASCVMMFLAIPFIMGPLRGSNMGLRLTIGIVMGFLFYFLNQFFGPLSVVLQLPPFLAAVLPSLLFFILGMILLRRVH